MLLSDELRKPGVLALDLDPGNDLCRYQGLTPSCNRGLMGSVAYGLIWQEPICKSNMGVDVLPVGASCPAGGLCEHIRAGLIERSPQSSRGWFLSIHRRELIAAFSGP